VIAKRFIAENIADSNVVNVIFDGRQWASFEDMHYETVTLNVGSSVCETSFCISESSHLVEMFLFRQDVYQQGNPNITWSLSTVGSGQPVGDIGTDVISFGDRAFHYYRACIPKDNACVNFTISALPIPEDMTPLDVTKDLALEVQEYKENITIRLVFGGNIYFGDQTYFLSWDETSYYAGDTVVTTFGNCSSSQTCLDGLALLQVDLVTGQRDRTWPVASEFEFSVGLYYGGSDHLGILWEFGPVLPLETYHFPVCFQYDETYSPKGIPPCSEFYMVSKWAENVEFAGYVVSLDGVVFPEREKCFEGACKDLIVTPLRGQCDEMRTISGVSSSLITVVHGVILAVIFAGTMV